MTRKKSTPLWLQAVLASIVVALATTVGGRLVTRTMDPTAPLSKDVKYGAYAAIVAFVLFFLYWGLFRGTGYLLRATAKLISQARDRLHKR